MLKDTLFYKRLKEQIELKNNTFNGVERELGYPRNSLSNYKNGTAPSGERLIELAEYFGVSPGYLIGKNDQAEGFSLKEIFQSLDFEQKRELYEICQSWATTQLSKNYRNK